MENGWNFAERVSSVFRFFEAKPGFVWFSVQRLHDTVAGTLSFISEYLLLVFVQPSHRNTDSFEFRSQHRIEDTVCSLNSV